MQVVMKQHKWYVGLSFFVAFGVPLLLASDKLQALFFGGFAARCLTWHSTWCVNSLAHWLGSDEYSNETSAKV
jgi:stearoyl-CoA desaturase (delta-9 desaturase)